MTTDELSDVDLGFLKQAIAVSHRSRANGNHPFGGILVDENGSVLLEVENTVPETGDCTAHAETNLVRLASRQFAPAILEKCTLYSSCEPCAMCSGAIHWSRIGRLVYGMSEDRLYQIAGRYPEMNTMILPCRSVFEHCLPGVEVLGPALEDEAAAAHEGFWK